MPGEKAGAVNVYRCNTCGHPTTTINTREGTTPFMILCTREACTTGAAFSSFYRVDQARTPTHEWYMPTDDEIAAMDDEHQKYHRGGAMALRPVRVETLKSLWKGAAEKGGKR